MYPSISTIFIAVLAAGVFNTPSIFVVNAFPDGAPVCRINQASPDSLHTFIVRQPRSGSLRTGGFQVLLNNEPLDTAIQKTVNASETMSVVVTSLDGQKQFRGILLILSQVGFSTIGTFQLTTDDELAKAKISDPCIQAGYGGITHIDAELKSNVTTTMKFDRNYDDLRFDVNIVVMNRNPLEGGSEYYYSQYTMKVEGANNAATKSPTPAPTRGCGLFGRSMFCPFTFCGFFSRLIFGSDGC
jgi:hypothetical protein